MASRSKLTLSELTGMFVARNKKSRTFRSPLWGVVVFAKESFTQNYPDKSRAYLFSSENNRFFPHVSSEEVFGSCLDGSDSGLNLDWYFRSWKVEYCLVFDHKPTSDEVFD